MRSIDQPVSFPEPWARDAVAPYIYPLPLTSQIGIQDGRASLPTGFVPLNFDPVDTGGVPPFGADHNAILKWLTQAVQWLQAGGPLPYDPAFQSAIGGYPQGAQVASVTLPGVVWRSAVDNNTTDPDTGGAGWLIAYAPRGQFRFLVSASLVVPPGITQMLASGCAGGAGGGGFNSGGAGQPILDQPIAVVPGHTLAVTIGAGGAPGNPGGSGGNTIIVDTTAAVTLLTLQGAYGPGAYPGVGNNSVGFPWGSRDSATGNAVGVGASGPFGGGGGAGGSNGSPGSPVTGGDAYGFGAGGGQGCWGDGGAGAPGYMFLRW